MSYDPAPQRGPESLDERVIASVVLVVGLGFLVAETATNYHPGKLVGLLFLVAWVPLIALHESGHAVIARLVGWHVEQVVVGFGKPMFSTIIGGAAVELRTYPLMGFVRSAPRDLRFPRLKDALVYFAGPGIELALAAGLIAAVGWNEFFSVSHAPTVIVAQAVGLAALAGGVLNLIPNTATIDGREIPNDGLGIVLSFTRPTAYYAARLGDE